MKGALELWERRTRQRLAILAALLGLGSLVVGGRAVQLHIHKNRELSWVAKKQYQAVIPMARQRGKILDARGQELAVSMPMQSIFADPSLLPDAEAAVAALEQVLPLSESRTTVLRRIRQGKRFAWVERRVVSEMAEQVKALGLPGIHLVEETMRIYPNQRLASQILGAVGIDQQPLGGVELAHNAALSGKERFVVYQRDARGRFFVTPVGRHTSSDSAQSAASRRATVTPRRADAHTVPAVFHEAARVDAADDESVGSVVLTIDKMVQYVTEQALERAATAAAVKGAVAVVVDPATGRILAMASYPTFDPNRYGEYPQEAWRNRAITDAYEPGSTFKVLVMAAAIEAGVDVRRMIDCQRGVLTIGKNTLHDAHPHGMLSVADIIKVSSNIGTAKIAASIGKERIGETLTAFGIGAKTGINFPGEVSGIFHAIKQWSPLEFATIAFGQGVTATPLQMTMAFAAIANDGVLMRPYLVERVVAADGTIVEAVGPQPVRQVVSARTAATMRGLLQRVVEKGGTGTSAASVRYPTAGKTGTAQKVEPGRKGYAAGRYYSSFIGMAPVEQPKIVVYVALDEPKGAYYGGAVAGPVFREIVEATLQYLEVPAVNTAIVVAERPQQAPADPGNAVDPQGVRSEGPVRPARAKPVEAAVEPSFQPQAEGRLLVPNVAGLSLREVVRIAGDAAVEVKVKGKGLAVSQRPAPGSVMEASRALEVEFALPQ